LTRFPDTVKPPLLAVFFYLERQAQACLRQEATNKKHEAAQAQVL